MVSTIIVDGICNVLSSRAVNLEWIIAILMSVGGLASSLCTWSPGDMVLSAYNMPFQASPFRGDR
jgi:hypothetical protein